MKDMEDAIIDDIEELIGKSKKKRKVFFLANTSSFEKDCNRYLNSIRKNKNLVNKLWSRYLKKNKIALKKLSQKDFVKIADRFLDEHLIKAVRKAYKKQLEKQKKRKIKILRKRKIQKKTIYVFTEKDMPATGFEGKFKQAVKQNPSVDVNYIAAATIRSLSDNEKSGVAAIYSNWSRKDFNQLLLKWKAEALNPERTRSPKTIRRKISQKSR